MKNSDMTFPVVAIVVINEMDNVEWLVHMLSATRHQVLYNRFPEEGVWHKLPGGITDMPSMSEDLDYFKVLNMWPTLEEMLIEMFPLLL